MNLSAFPPARVRALACASALLLHGPPLLAAEVFDDFSTTNNLFIFGGAISLTADDKILTAERTTANVDTGFDWRVDWFFSLDSASDQSQFQLSALQPLNGGFFVINALVFEDGNYLGEFTLQGDLNASGTFGYDIAAAAVQAGWTNANQWFPRLRVTPFGSAEAGFTFSEFGAVGAAATSVNGGTLTVAGNSVLGSGTITLADGAQMLFLTNRTLGNTIASAVNSSGILNALPGQNVNYEGEISVGAGSTLVFAGTNAIHTIAMALTGQSGSNFAIDGTTVELAATGTFAGGTFVYGGGTLIANGSLTNSTITISDAGTLTGTGIVGTTVISGGGAISPGSSPGTLTIEGDLIWQNGGQYDWEIFKLSTDGGSPGTGWDFINVAGQLDLSALDGSTPFTINIYSLSGTNTAGALAGFDYTQNYAWQILQSALPINFNPANLNSYLAIDASAFTAYQPTSGGIFSLALGEDGASLFLEYSSPSQPIPELSTWLAAALLSGGAVWRHWRRRARTSSTPTPGKARA